MRNRISQFPSKARYINLKVWRQNYKKNFQDLFSKNAYLVLFSQKWGGKSNPKKRYLNFFHGFDENIPSFVLHTFHLIYLAQDIHTFFMDWKFVNISSFPLFKVGNWWNRKVSEFKTARNGMCQIWKVAQDSSTYFIFGPPRCLYFFIDLKFEKHSNFFPPHFHLINLAQDRSKFSFFRFPLLLSSWIWNLKIFQVLSSILFLWYT